MAAASILKRQTALIWLPPRSVGERALVSQPLLLVASSAQPGAVFSRVSLESMPAIRSAVLLVDARDVTLVEAKVPALPAARLAQALPNIVEDQLLQDPAACVLALGAALGEGRRIIAAADRGWLEFVLGVFERRGVSVSAVWPAQLALAPTEGGLTVACTRTGLTIRTAAQSGLGWPGGEDASQSAQALAQALRLLEPQTPWSRTRVLLEDASWRDGFEAALGRPDLGLGFEPLGAALTVSGVDLLDSIQRGGRQRWWASIDAHLWRAPAVLALCCAMVALVGLNLQWLSMSRERARLQAELTRTFLQAFPKSQVVVDPLLQMQRQVEALRVGAGRSGPQDFGPMLARFAAALGPAGSDALSLIEYREGRLKVRFSQAAAGQPQAREALVERCARLGLRLQFDAEGQLSASVSLAS
jgi:general secretion pathway protein L